MTVYTLHNSAPFKSRTHSIAYMKFHRFQQETIYTKTQRIVDYTRLNQCSAYTQWMFYTLCVDLTKAISRKDIEATDQITEKIVEFIKDTNGTFFGCKGGWPRGKITFAQTEVWKELVQLVKTL